MLSHSHFRVLFTRNSSFQAFQWNTLYEEILYRCASENSLFLYSMSMCMCVSHLVGLAAGVQVGESVQALIVLGEAVKAQKQSSHTHLHKHLPLLLPACRQTPGHLQQLGWCGWLRSARDSAQQGGRCLGGRVRGRGFRDRHLGRSDGQSGVRGFLRERGGADVHVLLFWQTRTGHKRVHSSEATF